MKLTCNVLTVITSTEQIVIISSDTFVAEGETALFVCVGTGDPGLSVTWTRNGAPVINSSTVLTYSEDMVIRATPLTHAVLQICSVNIIDSGAYTCVVTAGQVTSTETVQLLGKLPV